jgi:hypothetical protein
MPTDTAIIGNPRLHFEEYIKNPPSKEVKNSRSRAGAGLHKPTEHK